MPKYYPKIRLEMQEINEGVAVDCSKSYNVLCFKISHLSLSQL
jgi:hypothetical protein